MLPAFETYGDYSNSNYGAHCLRFFDAQGNVYWFSYKTLVAFKPFDGPRVVRQNDWSTTTGKHLNAIDDGDKKSRVDGATFERLFQERFGVAA
jgi:hypothetical protein